jgi:hypothetical protein
MNLEHRPDHAVNWPRAVQSSVAILGALTFGAIAYGYGYGVSSGRTKVYSQAAPAAAASGVPVFGDDPADDSVFFEWFDGYADSTSLDVSNGGSWTTGGGGIDWGWDASGGISGTGALRFTKADGATVGPDILRTFGDSVDHIFVQFWTKFDTTASGSAIIPGKFVRLRFAETLSNPCAANTSSGNYQFPITTNVTPYPGGNAAEARLMVSYGTLDEDPVCDGPTNNAVADSVLDTWFVTDSATLNYPPAAMVSDAGMDSVSYAPLDNGAWRRWTAEIRTGNAGTCYWKLWMDDVIYYDNTGHGMNCPGRPYDLRLSSESGTASTHGFDQRIDSLRVWKRAVS